MKSDKTGVELLLSQPEILAWLGLDATHHDVRESSRRADSPGGGSSRVDWPAGWRAEVRQAERAGRALRVGLAL
jgi:hypothetical protein